MSTTIGEGDTLAPPAPGTRTGALAKWVLLAMAASAPACYQPEPLDARAVLNDLRASDGMAPALGGPPRPAAGSTDGSGAPLGEDRAVAMALLWNRDLRAFRLTRGIAEGEVVSAGALNNPEVRMELTHLQRRDWSQLGWDVRLTWEPPRPGVRSGRQEAAAARLEELDKQVVEREWDLACDVRTAHAALLALDEDIRVAEDTIANRRRLGEVVARRVQKGGTTRFELDLVRLSLASAEHAASERRLQRTLAANTLLRLMGVGSAAGMVTVTGRLDDGPVTPLALPAQNDLEDRALANRPAVAAARARHRATEETLRAETAARWPWFRFSAAPRVRRNEFVGATTDLAVGIDLILPILDTNRGHLQSARAARDVARAEVTTTVATLRSDIARALATAEAQQAILHRLQAETAPLLAEHDRVLAMAAQALELDLPAVIASENLILASRLELISARLELRKAWLAVERAVGTSVPQPSTPPSPQPALSPTGE